MPAAHAGESAPGATGGVLARGGADGPGPGRAAPRRQVPADEAKLSGKIRQADSLLHENAVQGENGPRPCRKIARLSHRFAPVCPGRRTARYRSAPAATFVPVSW